MPSKRRRTFVKARGEAADKRRNEILASFSPEICELFGLDPFEFFLTPREKVTDRDRAALWPEVEKMMKRKSPRDKSSRAE